MTKTVPSSETIEATSLIVGSRMEFCYVLYGALFNRLPDPGALYHFRSVPKETHARIAEVRKALASSEFAGNEVACEFSDDDDVPSLDDPLLRLSNFLSYVMPSLQELLQANEQLVTMRSSEIGELLREALATKMHEPAGSPVEFDPIDTIHDRLDALSREIESLKRHRATGLSSTSADH